jgi:hypothetical protein
LNAHSSLLDSKGAMTIFSPLITCEYAAATSALNVRASMFHMISARRSSSCFSSSVPSTYSRRTHSVSGVT